MQLYTMCCIIEHCAVPCVYGLMPTKEQGSYIHFYEAIRDAIRHNWSPTLIMSYFETASISAASIVFPNVIQSGCLFHFGKALYRRIQRLPILHNQYLQNIDFQRSIRSLQALSFVPQGLVYSYFCMLLSTLEPTNELRGIVGIVNKHKHVLSYRIYSILHKYLDRSKTYYSTRESYL